MNIVLIGYRCCGKTSAGKLVAEKLDRQFIDTDEIIVEKTGCSIDGIVSWHGWEHFRDIEKGVIKEVSLMKNIVIATGGGVVTNEENIKHLRANGVVIWLYADIDTIKIRLSRDEKSAENRPSLTGKNSSDEIINVLEQRRPLYMKASDFSIDTTNMEIGKVADAIIEKTGNSK